MGSEWRDQGHARPSHTGNSRRPTCANSVVRMAVTCLECSSFLSALSVVFFPTIVEYQCTRAPSRTLSSTMCMMKASSPPGYTISAAVPPQAVLGLESASDMEEKNGGLHLR